MVEYPTDLAVTEDLDLYIDGSNDLATISGLGQLQQSVALDVLDVTREFVGGRLTGRNVGLLEERVQRSLERDEQLSQVKTVNVVEYDRSDESVTMEVLVIDDEDFEITL